MASKYYHPQGSNASGTRSIPFYSPKEVLSFACFTTTTQIIIKSSCKKKKKVESVTNDKPAILIINYFSSIKKKVQTMNKQNTRVWAATKLIYKMKQHIMQV